MHKKKLFVDLDDTLINTSWLKEELIRLVSDLGVERETVLQRYNQSKDENGIPDLNVFASSFVDQNLIGEDIRSRIDNLYSNMDEDKFYTERMLWIEEKYPRDKYEYILMTKGIEDDQNRKMRNFNLQALFDRVYVVKESKAEAINGLVQQGERFVIIDDKISELKSIQEDYPQSEVLISPSEGNPQAFYNKQEEEPSRREG